MSASNLSVGIDVAKAELVIALVACMRKLLTILNAMVRTNTQRGKRYDLSA